ncbi:MAG: sodium:proton antiporter [Novosphingobium sp.]|nr:sodium:proton antiporter [Novosphingobium sp.]
MTASLVAMLSRRLRLPYSVGLVSAGIVLALLPLRVELSLSRELIFSVLLPPLVFEAALQLGWTEFRRELPLTAVLAFAGVALAAAVVASGSHFLLGWSWIGAGLFGMLIAATDPVSVIAAFRETRAEPRLALIVEAESLLNDGAAAVGFVLLAALAEGAAPSLGGIVGSLAWTIAGGIACGAAVAGLVLAVAGRTEDHLVEITLTTIAAYSSFLMAEDLHTSGVLATLTAGLVVGNLGWRGPISAGGRGHVLNFWEYAAFLANSFVFILIGGHEAHLGLAAFGGAAIVAIALVLIGRAAAVYPLALLFCRSRLRLPAKYQHVLVWGGLRGALALALALGIPTTVPERHEIIVVAFAVVAFSIFAQGLTMPWLIRRLGLMRAAERTSGPI